MHTSVPVGSVLMGTVMTSHLLDQVTATTAGLTALDGVASMMVSHHYSKQEA
jgi:hypothetical protein